MIPAKVKFNKKIQSVNGKKYLSGTFLLKVPLPRDVRWPMRSVTAEIVNVGNNKVLARDRVSLYDMRDSGANPYTPLEIPIVGIASQLTGSGIGDRNDPALLAGMEIAYLTSLPQPDLASFNDKLTQRSQSIPNYDDDSDHLGACIDYEDLNENNFSQTTEFGPYLEAYTWAEIEHQAYEIANDACNSLPNPGAILACKLAAYAAACVHNTPVPNDFELCVDQIEGNVTSLQIQGVDDVSLKFLPAGAGTRAKVESNISLAGVQSTVTGKMRNLSVRWKNAACLTRPSFSFNDENIPDKPWLRNWTSCQNLGISVANATSFAAGGAPAEFSITEDPMNIESLRATQTSRGGLVPVSSSTDSMHENCALSFINPAVNSMLQALVEPITEKLEDVWYSGGTDSQQAVGLTNLLSTYRLGEYGFPKHDIDTSVVSLTSDTETGMSVYWSTKINSNAAEILGNQKNSFFFRTPGFAGFSSDAKDHLGNNFDISYTINTGLLNRILTTRSASDSLHFDLRPTWQELSAFGVAIPPNTPPADVARLNEATMKQFDPAFRGIPVGELEIAVEPIFDAFVFMPEDVTRAIEVPDVGAPLAYGLENLSMVFKFKDKVVRGKTIKGKTILRTHTSFVDKSFALTLERAINYLYLKPKLSAQEWDTRVVTSKLPRCSMYSHLPGAGNNCEKSLENKITSFIQSYIGNKIENFVSRIPAPKLFDSLDRSTRPVEFNPQSTYQILQNITFFGKVREPQ